MKKSRKLLCVLLAAVMIFSMLSVMAFAADEDVAAEESVAASVEENSPGDRPASSLMHSETFSPTCPTIWSS